MELKRLGLPRPSDSRSRAVWVGSGSGHELKNYLGNFKGSGQELKNYLGNFKGSGQELKNYLGNFKGSGQEFSLPGRVGRLLPR